jgi:hypothetical protein
MMTVVAVVAAPLDDDDLVLALMGGVASCHDKLSSESLGPIGEPAGQSGAVDLDLDVELP